MGFKAEWETQKAILLALPHIFSDWEEYIDEVRFCYLDIIKNIILYEKVLICIDPRDESALRFLVEHFNKSKLDSALNAFNKQETFFLTDFILLAFVNTNDTWARDFGPISIEENGALNLADFTFNGWGMKYGANFDNQITKNLIKAGAFLKLESNINLKSYPFILEGGSIESNGAGLVLTNTQCLLAKNRNDFLNKDEIEVMLIETLGAKKILWLNYGYLKGDDTDSHIDTLARFISQDTIAYITCDDKNDEHYEALKKMEEELKNLKDLNNKPFNLVALPFVTPKFYENERLPATYANFLFVNNALLVPTYNDKNDELALKILQNALPNKKVIGIDCSALIRQHGSLHCISMQLY